MIFSNLPSFYHPLCAIRSRAKWSNAVHLRIWGQWSWVRASLEVPGSGQTLRVRQQTKANLAFLKVRPGVKLRESDSKQRLTRLCIRLWSNPNLKQFSQPLSTQNIMTIGIRAKWSNAVHLPILGQWSWVRTSLEAPVLYQVTTILIISRGAPASNFSCHQVGFQSRCLNVDIEVFA